MCVWILVYWKGKEKHFNSEILAPNSRASNIWERYFDSNYSVHVSKEWDKFKTNLITYSFSWPWISQHKDAVLVYRKPRKLTVHLLEGRFCWGNSLLIAMLAELKKTSKESVVEKKKNNPSRQKNPQSLKIALKGILLSESKCIRERTTLRAQKNTDKANTVRTGKDPKTLSRWDLSYSKQANLIVSESRLFYMKENEFWVGSLTYGLSWLHVNTICSRYLGVLVPGDYWWQGCHCPQSRAGSKGGHSSYQAQVVCFNLSGILYNWGKEKKPALRGLYAIPHLSLRLCHEVSWNLSFLNTSSAKWVRANPIPILVPALQSGRSEMSPRKKNNGLKRR